MATPTTLDGFLRDDEDNLSTRFGRFIADIAAKGDATTVAVNVRWRGQGTTSRGRLNPESIPFRVDSNGVPGLIDQIETLVTDRLGPSPFGTLEVSAYPPGKSNPPPFVMERTLIPSDSGGLGEPNLALTRGLLQEERATNRVLVNALVQRASADAIQIQALSQALTASATTRTATTAASDIGNFSNLIGLVALVYMAPHLKAAMGLHPEASLRDVVGHLRRQLGWIDPGVPQLRDAPAPPPGALEARTAPAPGAPAPAPAPPALQLPQDPAELADLLRAELKRDPARAERVLEALASDPEIVGMLFGGGAAPAPPDATPAGP